MELSRTIGTMAVVLGVVLAAGFAAGEDGSQGSKLAAPITTGQMKIEEREALRRAALEEQQKRKDAFERACNKPLKSDMDFDLCRAAYKRLEPGK